MVKLTLGAKPVDRPSAKMANIPGAVRQACCSAADIVGMILDKKLVWTGVERGVRGYLSVLVKVDEVKAAVRGPDHGGLTIVEVREALQANYRVVLALFKHGHLATFRAPNPVNRCVQTLPSGRSALRPAGCETGGVLWRRGADHDDPARGGRR